MSGKLKALRMVLQGLQLAKEAEKTGGATMSATISRQISLAQSFVKGFLKDIKLGGLLPLGDLASSILGSFFVRSVEMFKPDGAGEWPVIREMQAVIRDAEAAALISEDEEGEDGVLGHMGNFVAKVFGDDAPSLPPQRTLGITTGGIKPPGLRITTDEAKMRSVKKPALPVLTPSDNRARDNREGEPLSPPQ